jgi:hypothetical protein
MARQILYSPDVLALCPIGGGPAPINVLRNPSPLGDQVSEGSLRPCGVSAGVWAL